MHVKGWRSQEICALEGEIYHEVGVCDPDSPLPCRCPRREYVDPPTHLPFPPTRENTKKLEEWIRDYYRSSAFSICKRQGMTCTEGPPYMSVLTQFLMWCTSRFQFHSTTEMREMLQCVSKKGKNRILGVFALFLSI